MQRVVARVQNLSLFGALQQWRAFLSQKRLLQRVVLRMRNRRQAAGFHAWAWFVVGKQQFEMRFAVLVR